MIRTANLVGSVSRKAGGLFESVRRLVQWLAQMGMEVKVFGLEDEFTRTDLPAWAPLPVVTCRPRWPEAFGYSREFSDEVAAFRPDIIHSHGIWMYPSVATNRYSRKNRRPYLISAHGMLDPWAIRHSRWKKLVARILYEQRNLRGAHCLRALCDSEARAMRRVGLSNPIAIIPNGVDVGEMQSAECRVQSGKCEGRSRDWRWREGRKVLLFLGRIHAKKGLVNLLRTWGSAHGPYHSLPGGRESGWVLAVAGWDQGGHEAELKQLCTDLGLAWSDGRCADSEEWQRSDVVFLGPQFGEAKAQCYRRCDAFVLPSFSEGLPMAVLEAWAHGKPVLMTPECNLPEGFAAGAAVKVETGAQGIGRGLADLFEMSAREREGIGQRGRALVAERFAWPRIASEMRELYEWMLGGGGRPASLVED